MPRLPSGPFRVLTHLKYAAIPRGIGAYSDAGPLSGNVPPMTIFLLVTPGVAFGAVARSGAAAAEERPASVAISAPARSSAFLILPSLSRKPAGADSPQLDAVRARLPPRT